MFRVLGAALVALWLEALHRLGGRRAHPLRVQDIPALLDREDVLIVDTETTGLGPRAEVIEVAAVDTTGSAAPERALAPRRANLAALVGNHGLTEAALSQDYFERLATNAVPLDEQALSALAHSTSALDTNAWLAQVLHRIPPGQDGQHIPWETLHAQLADNLEHPGVFRRKFASDLRAVDAVYQSAQLTLDGDGLTLYHSRPPMAPQNIVDGAELLRSAGVVGAAISDPTQI